MKRVLLPILLACFALVGCYNDAPIDNSIAGEGVTTLTIVLPETRTSLGEKSGEVYPIYWSEGDCISMNGKCSTEAVINSENKSSATFSVNYLLNYPYSITYPYISTTSYLAPKVVFPAEQSYVEGSFAQSSAPMCGYVESENDKVELKHLATVLRLPVKAHKDGIILQKVVVKAINNTKISGTFSVDCQGGAVSATSDCSNTITYTLPSNFVLSASEESNLHIAMPAVDAGDCVVEFVDSKGGVMVGTWNSKSLQAGVVREFKSITYKAGATCSLPTMGAMDDELVVPYNIVNGYVRDSSGKGIAGVAVSDGFTVVPTNSDGYYSFDCSNDAWYIFLSVPSEYEVPINEYGQPCFYKKYDPAQKQYDFELKPLAGGKESKFALFVLTDTHVSTSFRRERFKEETIASIRRHLSNEVPKGLPCYGLTLGDLVSNSSTNNTGAERVNVRDLLSKQSVGFPVFQVMGNHDNTYYDKNNPIYADERNSTYNIKAQREHEDMFGPAN